MKQTELDLKYNILLGFGNYVKVDKYHKIDPKKMIEV